MRRVDALFENYGEAHRNRTNKAIHWICVPLITWSLLGLLWSASPALACACIAAAMVFYARLSVPLAVGMLGVTAAMILPLVLLGARVVPVSIAVFVLAWIGQLVGHRIEGRQPSFVEDLRFLLVGPAWLLHFVYRRAGVPY
jgi:uncharacterized membrane protein YGL010W